VAWCLGRCWFLLHILATKCWSRAQREVYTVTVAGEVTLRGLGYVMMRMFTRTWLDEIMSFPIGWNNECPDWWNTALGLYCMFWLNFNETWISVTYFSKRNSNIKFSCNPSSWSPVVPRVQTDRHDETKSLS